MLTGITNADHTLPITETFAQVVGDFDFHGAETSGLTHRMHPYPAKYIPQIPRKLILSLSAPGEIVADVFCGSGTTLVEALVAGRSAVGLDANPLACLIAHAKTRALSASQAADLMELREQIDTLLHMITPDWTSTAWRPSGDYLTFWFPSLVTEELAEILSRIDRVSDPDAKSVALTAFSSIIVSVSRQDSDTRYVRREKGLRPGDVVRRFSRALQAATAGSQDLARHVNGQASCEVLHADVATEMPFQAADLMVCSPPYPNAWSYHLYHQTRMLWLSMDQPKFKRIEIGSHRKYSSRAPGAPTPETFVAEMTSVMTQLGTRLRRGRHACFVIGDSIVRGKPVCNADLLADAASSANFKEVARLERVLQPTKKAFNPEIGKIKKEQIVIFENLSDSHA